MINRPIVDDVWREILSYLDVFSLGNVMRVSKKDNMFASNLLMETIKDANKVVELIKTLPFYQADLFVQFYVKSDAYRDLKKKYRNTPEELTGNEIILIAQTIDDIYQLDLKLLDKAIGELRKKIYPPKHKKQVVDVHIPNDIDLLGNLTIITRFLQLNLKSDAYPENRIFEYLGKDLTERHNSQYLNLQKAKIPSYGPRSIYLMGANFRGATFCWENGARLFFILRDSFLDHKKFSKTLDYLYAQIKDHPQKQNIKMCIRKNIYQALLPESDKFRSDFYPPVPPKTALELIEIAWQHPIAEHREFKDAKNFVKKMSLGLFEFKSNFQKDLLELKKTTHRRK